MLPHPEPMRNGEGVLVGAINMLVDITHQKKAERAVAHLASIVTSSADSIIGTDLSGIVTSWNRAAEALYGYAAHEIIGQPLSWIIPASLLDQESHILERIKRGETIEHYETIRRRRNGIDVTVSLTVSPVIDPQNRIIGEIGRASCRERVLASV